ncbi:flagellar protein FlaG, partial [Acinetobacter baumannii]|uniref:flagellar protein FlaG n=1 Tax=Acinetobacter baumannii TaxID=470 RepID=UPI0008DDE5F5
ISLEKSAQNLKEISQDSLYEKSGTSELVKGLTELENFFNEALKKGDELRKPIIDLERLNRILLSINKSLKIELDDKLNIPIYKIIDITTNEVLKQIPLEEILQFKRAFFEFLINYLKKKSGLSGVVISREV